MTENLKERTARNLFWGGLSNTLQQLLGLAVGIALARRLLPNDYGLVGMLTLFTLLAGCLQESGFTSALAIRKRVSHRDYNAVFWFSLTVSLCLYALLFCLAPLIASYNHTPELVTPARVVFLGFVVSSLSTAHFARLFREMRVQQRLIATFTGSLVSGALGISLAYAGFSFWALIAQDLCYKLVTTLLFWHFAAWRPSLRIDFSPIRQMFAFSSKLLVTNVLTHLNNYYLQSLLGHVVRRDVLGQYTQANKWNAMGYTAVGGTTGSVAQPLLASVEEERQLRVFRKMLRFTAFLSFPALTGLALVAPEFVPLALGRQWTASVPLLQLLCLGGACIPLSQLYANLLISRGKSAAYLCITVVFLIAQLLSLYALYTAGIQAVLIGVVLLQAAWVVIWHAVSCRYFPLHFRWLFGDTLGFAAVALAAAALGYAVAEATDTPVLRLTLKFVLMAAVYLGTMASLRVVVFRESVAFLKGKIRWKRSR